MFQSCSCSSDAAEDVKTPQVTQEEKKSEKKPSTNSIKPIRKSQKSIVAETKVETPVEKPKPETPKEPESPTFLPEPPTDPEELKNLINRIHEYNTKKLYILKIIISIRENMNNLLKQYHTIQCYNRMRKYIASATSKIETIEYTPEFYLLNYQIKNDNSIHLKTILNDILETNIEDYTHCITEYIHLYNIYSSEGIEIDDNFYKEIIKYDEMKMEEKRKIGYKEYDEKIERIKKEINLLKLCKRKEELKEELESLLKEIEENEKKYTGIRLNKLELLTAGNNNNSNNNNICDVNEMINKYKSDIIKCKQRLDRINWIVIDIDDEYDVVFEYLNTFKVEVYNHSSELGDRNNYYMILYNEINNKMSEEDKYKISLSEYEVFNERIKEKMEELETELNDINSLEENRIKLIKIYEALLNEYNHIYREYRRLSIKVECEMNEEYVEKFNRNKEELQKIKQENSEYLNKKESELNRMIENIKQEIDNIVAGKRQIQKQNKSKLISKNDEATGTEGDEKKESKETSLLSNDYYFMKGKYTILAKSGRSTKIMDNPYKHEFPPNSEERAEYEKDDTVYFRFKGKVDVGNIIKKNKNHSYVIKYIKFDRKRNKYISSMEFEIFKKDIRLYIPKEGNEYKIGDKVTLKNMDKKSEIMSEEKHERFIVMKENGLLMKDIKKNDIEIN